MADNTRGGSESGTAPLIATDEVTYSGETADIQLIRLVNVSGAEGSKTVDPISDADGILVSGINTAIIAHGDVAHGSGDSGNPIKIGGKAESTTPAAEADGDRVDAWFGTRGQLATMLVNSSGTEATTGAQYVEDTVIAADAGQGTLVVARRDNALSTLTPAEGDAVGLRVDTNGALWIAHGTALPTGTNNIGDVDVLTIPGVGGLAAHASPTSGSPVFIAGRASAAIPTDVGADGDAAGMWTNRNGAQMVSTAPHIGLNGDPWTLVHEAAQYTTAQTSTVLVAGGASEKIVVTKLQIQAFDTTSGTVIVYFGTGAYSRGTNRAIFDGEFKPSSTSAPGVIMDGPFIAGTNGDDIMVTSVGAIDITVSVWYYVIT